MKKKRKKRTKITAEALDENEKLKVTDRVVYDKCLQEALQDLFEFDIKLDVEVDPVMETWMELWRENFSFRRFIKKKVDIMKKQSYITKGVTASERRQANGGYTRIFRFRKPVKRRRKI